MTSIGNKSSKYIDSKGQFKSPPIDRIPLPPVSSISSDHFCCGYVDIRHLTYRLFRYRKAILTSVVPSTEKLLKLHEAFSSTIPIQRPLPSSTPFVTSNPVNRRCHWDAVVWEQWPFQRIWVCWPRAWVRAGFEFGLWVPNPCVKCSRLTSWRSWILMTRRSRARCCMMVMGRWILP